MEAREKWYEIRQMIGDKRRYTSSDAGSLKVGNENFSILIPNGYGDGKMRYAVLEPGDNRSALDYMRYFTMIEGKFNIYTYDCSSDPEDIDQTIEGCFAVYFYDGIVVLSRC